MRAAGVRTHLTKHISPVTGQ